ncbi:glycine zipper domain-containing protein [Aridibaculum aurantiacum]|uniref:glycine zipper domain-containing protein n=1 Tax=Aridibaculum aurantiacum TaxID=2810307 RepID=UPI001A963AB6|nr:glycine zipper domain-containing protein [Aridibaculum aurantiacum]
MKKYLFLLGLGFAISTFSIEDVNAQQREVKTKTRKGWSNKAKGAAIGGAAGAATGVAISKNDSKGALVGGAVGAGAGYLIGRSKDKKQPGRKRITKTKVTTRE